MRGSTGTAGVNHPPEEENCSAQPKSSWHAAAGASAFPSSDGHAILEGVQRCPQDLQGPNRPQDSLPKAAGSAFRSSIVSKFLFVVISHATGKQHQACLIQVGFRFIARSHAKVTHPPTHPLPHTHTRALAHAHTQLFSTVIKCVIKLICHSETDEVLGRMLDTPILPSDVAGACGCRCLWRHLATKCEGFSTHVGRSSLEDPRILWLWLREAVSDIGSSLLTL